MLGRHSQQLCLWGVGAATSHDGEQERERHAAYGGRRGSVQHRPTVGPARFVVKRLGRPASRAWRRQRRSNGPASEGDDQSNNAPKPLGAWALLVDDVTNPTGGPPCKSPPP